MVSRRNATTVLTLFHHISDRVAESSSSGSQSAKEEAKQAEAQTRQPKSVSSAVATSSYCAEAVTRAAP
jgi:hypothetical protein